MLGRLQCLFTFGDAVVVYFKFQLAPVKQGVLKNSPAVVIVPKVGGELLRLHRPEHHALFVRSRRTAALGRTAGQKENRGQKNNDFSSHLPASFSYGIITIIHIIYNYYNMLNVKCQGDYNNYRR